MRYQLLPSFNGLTFGSRASMQIPNGGNQSLGRILLQMGGTLTKATISEIVVRIGSRIVFGPVSGNELDAINAYRGLAVRADMLAIDFTEFDGLSFVAKEVGAIDMRTLRGQGIFVEVVNTLASGSPTLVGWAGWTAPQFLDVDKDGRPTRQEQLIHKLLRYVVPSGGGTRLNWQPRFNGAEIKRIHFRYTGTDWTALANGNLARVESRRNSTAWWDRIDCNANRFLQLEQRKVPQARTYVLDYVHDNIYSNTLKTAGNPNIEFNLETTAADTVTAFVECLDIPGNL
jgi:hypothetical protein